MIPQTKDASGKQIDKYRRIAGKLYVYNAEQNSYVYCWPGHGNKPIEYAIKVYESFTDEFQLEEDIRDSK